MDQERDRKLNKMYKDESDQAREVIKSLFTEGCVKGCEEKKCRYFHHPAQKRRIPVCEGNSWNYKPKLCDYNTNCHKGDFCKYAHTQNEVSYHPFVYKTKLCKNQLISKTACFEFGELCGYYHSEVDKRSPGLQNPDFSIDTYKIFKCPSLGCQPTCTKYHFPEERRRDPNVFAYSSVPCKFAKQSSFKSFVECPNGNSCNLSHTKNEVYYHPDFHMKHFCKNETCSLTYCPFKHDNESTDSSARLFRHDNESDYSSVKAQESLSFIEGLKEKKDFLCGCKKKGVAVCSCGELLCEDCMLEKCRSCQNVEVLFLGTGKNARADKGKFACVKCKVNPSTCLYRCGLAVCLTCVSDFCENCSQFHMHLLKSN